LPVIGPRFLLVAALIVLVAALVLGANLALLGYTQPGSDPVGQLTPARLMQIERSIAKEPSSATTAITPPPPPHDHHIPGQHSDD
jgi:hypothetical protein